MFSFITQINSFIWDQILIFLLVATGLFFTFSLRFIQFRYFFHMIKLIFANHHSSSKNLSSFQAFCTGVASRVGTGNIVGVAMAIYSGGPGAVFWMWVMSIISMSTSFAESSLAQIFKQQDDGEFYGGPAFYMRSGIGQQWLGKIFSILLILSFGLIFNAVQSNSISAAFEAAWQMPRWISGLLIAILSAPIIFGGIKRVAIVSEILVPIMATCYIILALIVVFLQFDRFWEVINLIFQSAFHLPAASSGMMGYGFSSAISYGARRGLFSNEAGMGSAPNIAAAADVAHPAIQGFVQMFGVFVDTILICTATAAIILFSGKLQPESGITGVELVQSSLNATIGGFGSLAITVAIFLFAFSTIAANYSLGEINFHYLSTNRIYLFIFRILVLITVALGSIGKPLEVWEAADLMMGLMAILNLIAILFLSKVVSKVFQHYKKAKASKSISFSIKDLGFKKFENNPLINYWK